jgi:hypothetical protein
VREAKAPLHFCNRYVLNGSASAEAPAPLAFLTGFDVQQGLQLIGNARFAALHVERVSAGVRIERGAKMAHILDVRGPRTVRPGQRVRLALRVRVDRGPLRTLRVPVRIPRDAFGGLRPLRVSGSAIDIASSDVQDALSLLLDQVGGLSPARGAESLHDVVRRFKEISRYDGVRAQLGPDRWRVYRDDAMRIDGSASTLIRVVGSRRHGRPRGGSGLGRIFAELLS